MYQLFITDFRDGTQECMCTPNFDAAVAFACLLQYHRYISVRLWDCMRKQFV